MSLYYNVHITLHQFTIEEKRIRQNIGHCSDWNA